MKKYLQLGILFFGISFLLKSCEIKEDIEILNQEELADLNLKTVSFEEAQSFFTKKEKESKKLFAAKGTEQLELVPDWSSIKHEDLYGIEQAQLTEANVKINRSGDYTSKLFFMKINDKIENVIFTVFPKEISGDGRIIEASFFYNKLSGEFIDGYKIEEGKTSKKISFKQ